MLENYAVHRYDVTLHRLPRSLTRAWHEATAGRLTQRLYALGISFSLASLALIAAFGWLRGTIG